MERMLLNRYVFIAVLLIMLTGQWATVQAKPGTLAQSPLFLGTAVDPNIFFLLDDSGSMNWENLLSTGARKAYPLDPEDKINNLNFTPSDDVEKRRLCAGYNVMAYNPSIKYTPWVRKNSAENIYQNMTLSEALSNPYQSSSKTDISNHYYYVWQDNSNGEYEAGECPVADTDRVFVKDLPAAQQINYANWYSYYRKRQYVLKRAVSELISDSDVRMGLATLHNNNSVGTPVKDMSDSGTRDALLENLFRIQTGGDTPLRRALRDVGRYFDNTDGSLSHDLGIADTDESPILPASSGGECQQNFAVMVSDGFWNEDFSGLGNEDGNNSSSWDGGAQADSYSDTLADVAMYYYERDLSTLPNKVPTRTGVDENNTQHMVTFTVGFGVDGTLSGNPPNRTDPFPWPNPHPGDIPETTDDMRHAVWNARGMFLSARNPQELVDSLSEALKEVEERRGTAAAVTFNAHVLGTDTQVYVSQFDSRRWKGDVLAFSLDPYNGNVATTPKWRAADALDIQSLRVIFTYDGTDGAPFQWSTLADWQKADLRTNPDGTTASDTTAQARLDYLRGGRDQEGMGLNFRARDSRLGDIIHSAPLFVGQPELRWPDTAPFPTTNTYSAFKAGYTSSSRREVIYVGANDGVLHGFAADTGVEVLAYVPNALFSSSANKGLHYLTDPAYGHRYYVDLAPTVSDAYIRTTPSGSPSWRTVLVGGLGAGGRGLYALDVTDPNAYTESTTQAQQVVLWEFDQTDDADLGYTFSAPTIAMMNNGKWAAIFGNGYNNSGTGQAALFIVFLEDGLDGTWTLGTDYLKITTGVGTATDPNGLSSPAVADVDGNGTADRVYAGDLVGNMWAFDLSNTSSSNWAVAYNQAGTPKPLLTAASNQPITAKPILSFHPEEGTTSNNKPNLMVYFGTGQYLVNADKSTTNQQSFYGIWDHGVKALTQSNLITQALLTGFPDNVRALTDNAVDWKAKHGWYINLDSGERVVADAVVRGDLVFFNTLVPSSAPCSYGGSGWLMAVKSSTGGTPPEAAFDYNNDGKVNSADLVKKDGKDYAPAGQKFTEGLPAGSGFLGDYQYTSGTGTTEGPERRRIVAIGGARTGRLSWQELLGQ